MIKVNPYYLIGLPVDEQYEAIEGMMPVGIDLEDLMKICKIDNRESICTVYSLPEHEEIWLPREFGTVQNYAEDNWSGRDKTIPMWKDVENDGIGYCGLVTIPDVGIMFFTQNACPVALHMNRETLDKMIVKFDLDTEAKV